MAAGSVGEHYVSECVFPDQPIFVQGLDWCLDTPKNIRIESLTAKILCRDHNSALSELDSAAGRAFQAMQDYATTTRDRAQMPYVNWAPKHFTIDGPRLERWCLKTLLNFSFGRKLMIGAGSHEPGKVPIELVRVTFGLEQFSGGQGLYTAFRPNEKFDLEYRFGYTAKAQGSNLVMGSFRLFGFRFYLNLLPPATELTQIEESQVFYRQTHFAHNVGKRFSHRLSIAWPQDNPEIR